jgi:transketolase
VAARFEAYGWHVQQVDGSDLQGIAEAITAAQNEHGKPSLIQVRTHIGHGSPNKQDTSDAHGAALGADEVKLTKQALGWPAEPSFLVPEEVRERFRAAVQRGERWESEWQARFGPYKTAFPELAQEWDWFLKGELPRGWNEKLSGLEFPQSGLATRQASGKVLNAVAGKIRNLIGGSSDLTGSNETLIRESEEFHLAPEGRILRFGVREHAMGAILNGMALHGGVRPYGGTFLVFSDYMRPSVRLAALTRLPVIYVFTHDSLGVGEDGPTHQPVEHLAALRAIPRLRVVRPADATETVAAWRLALERRDGPTALILTRQKVPLLDRNKFAPAELTAKGAYILADAEAKPMRLILIATGSEVSPALVAKTTLEGRGIGTRVVSMPCWELFNEQSRAYQDEVLPPSAKARLAIEAASPMGWRQYVGDEGDILSVNDFGASAPGGVLMEKFGFTAANIVARATALLRVT